MTSLVDIANQALQVPGTRTTVTEAELTDNTTNEAIQLNLSINNTRRTLLRMAPWDCALKTANLTYITSISGTPENTSPATALWQPGQPTPPWAYEYQYPVDCVRACWIVPNTSTGYAGGIPITSAVGGGAVQIGRGPPVPFKVQTDTFYYVTAVNLQPTFIGFISGSGYAVGDIVTLYSPPSTSAPNGAPVQVVVTAIDGGTGILTMSVINQLGGSATPKGGSYFAKTANPVAQGSTSGSGSGASFVLTWAGPSPQRVVLTNQQSATMVYCQDVVDPDVMDDAFQAAWINLLGAAVTIPLTGDKKLANMAIQEANVAIQQARSMDGNEGLTVNDTLPDWLRIRGVGCESFATGVYGGFDWGPLLSGY
jgi:hypothetical protein